MATASDIEWGSYRLWEGPFYRGTQRYELPASPDEDDRILAVITATEGGRYDAINMYDGQIMSSGLIQFIERGQFSVSAMLGHANEQQHDHVYEALYDALGLADAYFGRNPRRRWRFFFRDERHEVDRESEQRQLMHGFSDGQKGTWGEPDKRLAKAWAAAVATVWELPGLQRAQREFTVPKLRKFAFRDSSAVVRAAEEVGTNYARAFVAAYLSFAVNNPVRADKHLGIALLKNKYVKWGKDWLISVLRELTFGPEIAIYPHRYDAIRPKLEELYGIDLPDFADELQQWKRKTGHEFFFDTREVQVALELLGFDLGPAGVDGQYGRKTREAVYDFERLHGVTNPDGMMDPTTTKYLSSELYARGLELLSDG